MENLWEQRKEQKQEKGKRTEISTWPNHNSSELYKEEK